MKPWEFRNLDNEQQAELHAAYDAQQMIEMYYNSEKARMMDAINK